MEGLNGDWNDNYFKFRLIIWWIDLNVGTFRIYKGVVANEKRVSIYGRREGEGVIA